MKCYLLPRSVLYHIYGEPYVPPIVITKSNGKVLTNGDRYFKYYRRRFVNVHEGDDDTVTGGGGDDTVTGGGGDDDEEEKKIRSTFNDEQNKRINDIIAKEKRRLKAKNEEIIKNLEGLKKEKNLSDQQKKELQQRIDELERQTMSKEEIAKKEREKLEKQHKETMESVAKDRDHWRNLYVSSTKERSLTDAAIRGEAYNPKQIVQILTNQTTVKETVDSEGKPTGVFSTIVHFEDVDSEGKPMTFEITPEEAMTRMKDLPEKYGNLFKSGVAGGLGAAGSNGSTKRLDFSKMSAEQYMEQRKKDPNFVDKLNK